MSEYCKNAARVPLLFSGVKTLLGSAAVGLIASRKEEGIICPWTTCAAYAPWFISYGAWILSRDARYFNKRLDSFLSHRYIRVYKPSDMIRAHLIERRAHRAQK